MKHAKRIVPAILSVLLVAVCFDKEPEAADSAISSMELLLPGLTAEVICNPMEAGVPPCPDIVLASGDTILFPLQFQAFVDLNGRTDALGNLYVKNDLSFQCGSYQASHARLFRMRLGTGEDVFRIPGECGQTTMVERWIAAFWIDPTTGQANLHVATVERRLTDLVAVDSFSEYLSISGLPTLLDIILSYQPPSTLSFNVPVRPEGLVGADSFSVYHGDVRTATDLSQATPLECTVPAGRPPVPGEHLTVADPLPDPAPGDARYYVAAVNYQGQRRAGRSSTNGVLQGRNAAALPVCE